jgi:SAM-dependent methyltransferase
MKICLACGLRFNDHGWKCQNCGHVPKMVGGHWVFQAGKPEGDKGFDAGGFKRLVGVEEGNWWFRSRNRLIHWVLRHYFPQARNFLEIGCGTGFVLLGIQNAFPGLSLSGSELFGEGLTYAHDRLPHVPLFQMDARRIPFEDEFDVIGAFDVLEHIRDDENVLLQMAQATQKGGGVIITVPQHRFLWTYIDDYSYHKRRYARKELAEKVERAGFKIIYATSFVSFLLPMMLVARLKQRRSKGPFDPLAEFKINPLLNLALEKVMSIERVAIRSGISFPSGGSLLLVAKRSQR